MAIRICPECDRQTDKEICPHCRVATIIDRREKDQQHPIIGKILNRKYLIEEFIGKGGMGSVFRATNISINRKVAIKIMHKDLVESTDQVKRFCKEARLASMLEHPHTVKVYDFGETEEGLLYIVMEFLKGRTLTRMLAEQGALTENRVMNIAHAVAQSLAEAHAKGIVHRDLKSDNVMILDYIGQKDFVKVLDFGIAKFVAGESGDSSLTKTGMLVGSPHFMAPEQVRGESLDGRCDIYSLGIIMYHALCNRLPFVGETPIAVLMAHLNKNPADFPPWINAGDALKGLILKLISKEREVRPSAEELISILAQMREGAGITDRFKAQLAPQINGSIEKTASSDTKIMKDDERRIKEKKEAAGFPLRRDDAIWGGNENGEYTVITKQLRRKRLIQRIALGIGSAILLAGVFLFFTQTGGDKSGETETFFSATDAFIQKDNAAHALKTSPDEGTVEPDSGVAQMTQDVQEILEKTPQEYAGKKTALEETPKKETPKPEKKKVHIKPVYVKKAPVIKQVIEKKKELIEKEKFKNVKKIDF